MCIQSTTDTCRSRGLSEMPHCLQQLNDIIETIPGSRSLLGCRPRGVDPLIVHCDVHDGMAAFGGEDTPKTDVVVRAVRALDHERSIGVQRAAMAVEGHHVALKG